MKNNENSPSFPNSWELSRSFSEKDDEYNPVTSPLRLQEFTHEIGGASVEDDAVGADETSNRKTRGRPRGSKNKPKLDVEEISGVKLEVHEIPPGTDVINSMVQLAQCKQLCVTVLSGSGLISLVDLSHGASNLPPVTISGPLSLISFSGTFVISSSSLNTHKGFAVSLKRFDQHIFGGEVAGRMIASSPVILIITTFNNPEVYELGD